AVTCTVWPSVSPVDGVIAIVCLGADVVVVVGAWVVGTVVVVFGAELFLLDEPHAASSTVTATTASSAAERRRVDVMRWFLLQGTRPRPPTGSRAWSRARRRARARWCGDGSRSSFPPG